jgi:hypothetical protein
VVSPWTPSSRSVSFTSSSLKGFTMATTSFTAQDLLQGGPSLASGGARSA